MVTGEEGKRVETESKENIIKEIGSLMSEIYGKNDKDKTKYTPIDIYVTNWGQNPYYRGSYTFFPVKAFKDASYEDFIAPLSSNKDGKTGQPKLFFTGEAFSREYAGFVHGAYLNG